MNTPILWSCWDVDQDISLGVWECYSAASNFQLDNQSPEENWTVLPYEETLEYITN